MTVTLSKSTIKYLCQKHNLKPSRSSGQNFLCSQKVLDDMIAAAKLANTDNVLEIGAGFGTLTVQLAEKANQVWAVEIEKRVRPALKKIQKAFQNITVIEQDARKLDLKTLTQGQSCKVVANIPFNITSLLIKNLLQSEHPPTRIVLLVQKELAERIVSQAPQASLLSISVEFFARAELVRIIPKTCFWPEPKVDSAIISITPDPKHLLQVDPKQFFQAVKAGFSQKRKQLKNSLAAGLCLEPDEVEKELAAINLDGSSRAQHLSVAEWVRITNRFFPKKQPKQL